MKCSVRLFACLLCLAALFSLASCGSAEEETAPQGMMIASCAGADYRLYVPTTWVSNTSYGVSGAYRNLSTQSTVSVNRYPITEELRTEMNGVAAEAGWNADEASDRIQWFAAAYCEVPIRERALDRRLETVPDDCFATALGGVNARQYHYTALINGTTLHFRQVIAELDDAFYVFTFTATAEMYEMLNAEVDSMLEYFVFADPYIPPDYAKKLDDGKNAPVGMKSAFGEDVAYCLYVPQDWEIDMDQSIYSAMAPADRSSVSVVPYMPSNEQMSVQEYFEMSRILMVEMAGEDGFELISDTEKAELGGRQATVYEYRLRVGGVFYRYRQYIVAYKSMIYCLTYTAQEQTFDGHLGELEAIVSAFRFR